MAWWGRSPWEYRLRQALLDAAQDDENRSVLIRGEPGLEKDNLAALVNYGSTHRRQLLVGLDAGDLQGSGRLLLDELKDSTLLVSGIDRLEPAVQQRLISMACGYHRCSRAVFCSPAKPVCPPSMGSGN